METIQRRLYTPKQVQEIFQISRPTFAAWCESGTLKKIKIPGARRVFVSAENVEALIQSRSPKVRAR